MEELISVFYLCIGTFAINILYINLFLKRKHKSSLLTQLKELSKKLGYKVIEDKSLHQSKIFGNKIILGTDIDYQFDVTKLTELMFELTFTESIMSKNSVFLLRKFTKAISIFNLIASLVFSVGIFIYIIFENEGFMMTAFVAIIFGGIISLIVLSILYLYFKENSIQLEASIGKQKTELIQTLYWYIPITVFNSFLRPTDFFRWLFSKN